MRPAAAARNAPNRPSADTTDIATMNPRMRVYLKSLGKLPKKKKESDATPPASSLIDQLMKQSKPTPPVTASPHPPQIIKPTMPRPVMSNIPPKLSDTSIPSFVDNVLPKLLEAALPKLIEAALPRLVEAAQPKESVELSVPSLVITEKPAAPPAIVELTPVVSPAPVIVEQPNPAAVIYKYTAPSTIEQNKAIQLSASVSEASANYNCIACVFNTLETRYDTETNTLYAVTLQAGIRALLKQYPSTPGFYFGEAGAVSLTADTLYYESPSDSGFWLSTSTIKILLGVYSRTVFLDAALPSRDQIREILSNHGITPAQI